MEKKKLKALDPEEIEDQVVCYFDLEFCNDLISRHNYPVSIGLSYRRGLEELDHYSTVIRTPRYVNLWEEQLNNIGQSKSYLYTHGARITNVAEHMLWLDEKYHPAYYLSFGAQDGDMLKKYTHERLLGLKFYDALAFLPKMLDLSYDISLENYARICRLDFEHVYDPLEDARALGQVVVLIGRGEYDSGERDRIVADYERKIFVSRYLDRQNACQYLEALPRRSERQEENLRRHRAFLKENQLRFLSLQDQVEE